MLPKPGVVIVMSYICSNWVDLIVSSVPNLTRRGEDMQTSDN